MAVRGLKFTQHRLKTTIKPWLVSDKDAIRTIRLGPARGCRMVMNRMTDMQREFGLYETELNNIYRSHIRPNSVVFDIGAADGLTAMMFAKVAMFGEVVAFEPSDIADCFARNLALNPQLAERIRLVRKFVSSKHGVSIDAFVAADPDLAPDFVKIDVDGEELAVVDSMLDTLIAKRPTVLIETHGLDLELSCRRAMEANGYRTRIIKNARWRLLYPEWRPIEQNRWLLCRSTARTSADDELNAVTVTERPKL